MLMLVMVVPKLAKAFEEMGVELPLTTQLIIGLGNFAAHYWYLLPVIIIVLFFLFRMILRKRKI